MNNKPYTILLRDEFIRRKAKNRAYTLSAFAKQLKLDQSLFSKILSGKKNISDRMAGDLMLRAGIVPEKIKFAISGFNLIHEDEFHFLSDWLPFAILELMKTQGFKSDVKWIAQRLKMHSEEVQGAIGRLERLGFVRIDKNKMHLLRPNNDWANTRQTSEARKQFQKKVGELSLKAIDEVPFEQRDHGSLTVAVNKKQLPELKKRLDQFRLELGQFLQNESALDEVYQITMTAFPLTKIGD